MPPVCGLSLTGEVDNGNYSTGGTCIPRGGTLSVTAYLGYSYQGVLFPTVRANGQILQNQGLGVFTGTIFVSTASSSVLFTATAWGQGFTCDETSYEATFTRCEDSGECHGTFDNCGDYDCPDIINNYGVPAALHIGGSVNDEVLIDGVIYEDGQYVFWPQGSPCDPSRTNGAHGFGYDTVLQPGQSITVSAKDNCCGGGIDYTWTLTPFV